MRSLPVVSTLIAAPCDVPWDSMHGDDTRRHCGACKRDVHNLSAMTSVEMQAFLEAATPDETGHLPCISLFQRTDGTVLTADCPVGLSARRRRSLLTSTLGIGAVALVAMTALATLWLDHKRELAVESFDDPPAVFGPKTSAPAKYLPDVFGTRSDRAPEGIRMAGAMPPPPPQSQKPVIVTPVTPPPTPSATPTVQPHHMQLKGKMVRPQGLRTKQKETASAEKVLKAAMEATDRSF